MISVNELRAGITYEENGQLLQVVSFEHIKMGRGSANIKVKVKNVRTGSIVEKSFINSAKVADVAVIKIPLQFLYKDEDAAYFMNQATFDQVSVPLVIVPEHAYLKEGETFTLSFLGDEALSLELPPKMEFSVTEADPAVRGNSATNIYKDAELENGVRVRVPLFIKPGDKVRIDTRTGEYSEKV